MRTRPPRGTAPLLAVVFGAGLALRLLHARAVLPLLVDQAEPVGMDRWLNTTIASAVAHGDWAGGWAAAYDSSPGYSYLLAALYRLCGQHWAGPVVIQAVLGALAPLLLFGVGRRLYSWTVGVLAALLGALCTPAIFYEGLLVKFSLVPFTMAAFLFALVRLRETASARWGIGGGLLLGLLVLLRPNTAAIAPIALLWPVAGRSRGLALRMGLLVGLGALAVLGPMAVRNHLAERRGLGGSLWGIHFYIGTNPHATGEYVEVHGVRPDAVGHVVDARRIAEQDVQRDLSPREVSWYWFRRGTAFVRAHPARYLVLEARKLWLTFEAAESGSFGDEFDELRTASPVLHLPLITFAILGPLGLLGFPDALHRRGAALLPAVVLAVAASLLPFFVAGRYRLPLVPPMVVLAAVGLVRIDAWRRRSGSGALLAAAAGTILLAVLLGATDAQVLSLLATLGLGGVIARELGRESVRPLTP